MASITVRDTAHWHELRQKNIGSSEIGALFDDHPYTTRWQLWYYKQGKLTPENIDDDERVREGKYFEAAIAGLAAEKFGIQLRKVRRYITADDCLGMGSSVDYEQYGEGFLVPTEIKWSLIGDGWEWEGDEIIDAPTHYLLQVQHQLACMPAAPHGQLIAYAGGRLRRMIIERRPALIEKIKNEVAGFWWSIQEGKEPSPDFARDSGAISQLAAVSKLMSQTLSGDPEMDRAMRRFLKAKRILDAADEIAKAEKARITKRMIDVAQSLGVDTDEEGLKCVIGDVKISFPLVKEKPDVTITEEMAMALVGTVKPGRRAFRQFRATPIKTKAKKEKAVG